MRSPKTGCCGTVKPALLASRRRLFLLEEIPLKVAEEALSKARKEGYDVLIVDTAGQLHIDEPLMQELQSMKKRFSP